MRDVVDSVAVAETERSVAPIVGMILLVGMVFIGATIVAITGVALVDSLESETELDGVRTVAEDGNHCLHTAAFSNDACEITMSPHGAQSTVTDDGTMGIVSWEGGDDVDPFAPSGVVYENTTVDPLGAIEHRHEDRTIVNQIGGIWEVTDDGTAIVRSPPDIGLDGETLEFAVLTASSDEYSGGDATVQVDQETSQRHVGAIQAVTQSGYDNVTIGVESEFYEAWGVHFADAFGAEDDDNVSVAFDHGANRVTVTVVDIGEPLPALPVVDDDIGIDATPEPIVENGDPKITGNGGEPSHAGPSDGGFSGSKIDVDTSHIVIT